MDEAKIDTAGRRSVVARSSSEAERTRRSGIACIVGASILAVGAVVTQIAEASTSVPEQVWRYPWPSGMSIAISSLWAVAQGLLVVGLLGLRRSGVAGSTRPASVGLAIALAGTSLIVVGHLASIPVRDQLVNDAGAGIVGAVFGFGTVLSAIGLLLVGRATLRAGLWRDWRRFTPLAAGIWTVVLLGLQFTPVLPPAVAMYALCFLALGIALARRPTVVTTGPASHQVHEP